MNHFLSSKASLSLAIFCFFLNALHAQLTITLTSIPSNTPVGTTIYIAGNFNNWSPGNAAYTMAPTANGQYAITIMPPTGVVEFKFTRGDWSKVEGGAGGGFQPNHQIQYNGGVQNATLAILSWEDLGSGNPGGGTAASNVSILDNAFYIPQLNRERRIWLYLPPDYATTNKKYPVLYLQDGQNLFDDATSFAGEWKIDESLNGLFTNGDYGCIVVGIDNGGITRLDEYSPWVNTQYGGGEAGLYLDFIVNTLKPFVDAQYRTLPDRLHTGVGGSSMGGLFAEFALIERQDVFSKAAVFSPAFWFGGDASANHAVNTGKQADVRAYFLAGGSEPDYVATDMNAVADAMLDAGFDATEIYYDVHSDGQHSEWFWAREFPDAYIWLFQNSVSAVSNPANTINIELFPNPSGEWMRVGGLDFSGTNRFNIIGSDGKVWQDSTLREGQAIQTGDLPNGLYFLQIKKAGQIMANERFAVMRK